MSPLPVLASAAGPLDAANPTIFVGLLIGGLTALAILANNLGSIIDRFRAKPPIHEQLAGFASRAELASLDTRLTAQLDDVRKHISSSHSLIYKRIEEEARTTRTEISGVGDSIEKEFRTLYRAIGKIEGVTLEDPRR
ncbi:hypothetical protein ASA1KI_20910 [Opitutales bacterium ASA1]|uniref:hypothetical protein n=1 Tax=Congregicoccus parvus TaxID=3081749 RepID=UPI002B2EDC28|nr:hypothetical protein ASA1KI_20910 [Opitutales bacterium ASA1]